MRYLICGVAALALMACEPTIPDSGAAVVERGQGVGFSDYDSYEAEREARLNGTAPATTIAAPPAVNGGTLGGNSDAVADSNARIAAAAANSGVAPLDASPSNAAPTLVENARGISGENDFDAVAAQRDIQDDARMIANNRAQYQVVAPEALPTRESGRPNIVAFALQTTNPVGTALYKRGGFNAEAKYQRACASFVSADLAQEEFLANGGPEKDRQGMDPDGDGFACSWNPAPFRAVRGG